jgi:preprotein translocase subunit SecE
MASVTQQPDEKSMSDRGDDEEEQQRLESQRTEPLDYRPVPSTAGGFFHLYKSGQGYWTRLGTAAGAFVLGAFFALFIYQDLPPRIRYLQEHGGVRLGLAVGFFLGFALLAWWMMNKPRNADFLIATDSEMKKVNWTSRKDLIGSTKVVIFFMFLIAFLLFAIDILFGYVFFGIRVLKSPPF